MSKEQQLLKPNRKIHDLVQDSFVPNVFAASRRAWACSEVA